MGKAIMSKFYAVKKGRVPGIYLSWPACQEQIQGFSGAVYKSFKSQAEANKFMAEKVRPARFDRTFYTDGSFMDGKGGGAAIDVEGKRAFYRFVETKEATNNRGELTGILLALGQCKEGETVLICTDSQYSINVVEGTYDANSNLDLIREIQRLMKKLQVWFEYVQAHVGIEYNELADRYAKLAASGQSGSSPL